MTEISFSKWKHKVFVDIPNRRYIESHIIDNAHQKFLLLGSEKEFAEYYDAVSNIDCNDEFTSPTKVCITYSNILSKTYMNSSKLCKMASKDNADVIVLEQSIEKLLQFRILFYNSQGKPVFYGSIIDCNSKEDWIKFANQGAEKYKQNPQFLIAVDYKLFYQLDTFPLLKKLCITNDISEINKCCSIHKVINTVDKELPILSKEEVQSLVRMCLSHDDEQRYLAISIFNQSQITKYNWIDFFIHWTTNPEDAYDFLDFINKNNKQKSVALFKLKLGLTQIKQQLKMHTFYNSFNYFYERDARNFQLSSLLTYLYDGKEYFKYLNYTLNEYNFLLTQNMLSYSQYDKVFIYNQETKEFMLKSLDPSLNKMDKLIIVQESLKNLEDKFLNWAIEKKYNKSEIKEQLVDIMWFQDWLYANNMYLYYDSNRAPN